MLDHVHLLLQKYSYKHEKASIHDKSIILIFYVLAELMPKTFVHAHDNRGHL